MRTVSVKFVANMQQFGTSMKDAVKTTRDFRTELKETAAQGKGDLDAVANSATVFGAALVGAFALVANAAADFDHAMAQVNAVSNATAEEFASMRQAAIDMGSTTAFSATEAANAIEELSKAGLTAAQITGGALAGALSLAAAGGIGLAEAASIAATTLAQFNLEASEMSSVADTLAGSANASNTDVTGLGQSLKNVGTVAAQAGLTVEETVGILSAMGDQALVGAEAGTNLKTTLLRLLAPTKEAKTLMDDLGISIYDANGQVLSAVEIVRELETGLETLSVEERNAAMAVLFGQEAIAGANILLAEGSAGIQQYIDKVSEQGVAADTAAKRMDSLKGDISNLTSALEGLAIESSGGATAGLRVLVKAATDLVQEINDLPTPVSATAVVLGVLTGAALLTFGAAIKLRGQLAVLNAELAATGPAGAKAAGALSKVGMVAGGVLGALAAIEVASSLLSETMKKDLNPQVDALGVGLERWAETGKLTGEAARVLGDDIEGLTETMRIAGDEQARAMLKFQGNPMGLPLNLNDNKMEEAEEQIKAVDAALALLHGENADAAVETFNKLADAAMAQGMTLEEVKALFPEYAAALENAGAAAEEAAAAAAPYAFQLEYLQQLLGAQGETAEEAVAGMIAAWSDAATDFVDLLGAYSEALAGLEEDQELTTQGFIEQLRAQAEAQEQWAANLQELAARGVGGMINELAAMGPEGAEMVALMAEMTDAELAEVVELWGRRGDQTGQEIAEGIIAGIDESEDGIDGLQNAIDGLHGTTVDIVLQTINQEARNRNRWAPQANRWGGVYTHAAMGLLNAGIYSPQNPARYAFAEPATGGEAFIPRRGNRARSLAILEQAAAWYGAEVNTTQWRGARPVPVATTADIPETAGLPARRIGSTVVERQEVIVQAHTDVFSYRQVMDEMSWHGAT
jgi:TP901 family phage tail tape measure protein